MEDFAYDLKTAETKDDILAQLNKANIRFDDIDQAQLDNEIKNGSARSLACSLHHRLLVRPLRNKTKLLYFKKLNKKRTLQVMVLCNVIDRLVHRSDLSLSDYGQQFVDDLSASLPRVVKILAFESGDLTIRFVTISSCIRIMRTIATASFQPITSFGDSLFFLLNGATAPSDILIDAACAIACFVALDKSGQLISKVKDNAGALLSILGAAASADSLRGNALPALSQLGHIPVVGSMMAKRRGLVMAIKKHLTDSSLDIRRNATALIGLLIANYGDEAETPSLFGCNLTLISRSLTKAALKESNLKLRLSMINTLSALIQKKNLDSEHACQVMETFFEMATSSDTAEQAAMESALAYLHAACDSAWSVDVLSPIAHFTTSPYAKVRVKALELLKDITFWKPDSTTLLLSANDMLDSFSLIVTLGSDADCCLVTEICKQIVFEDHNHAAFCKHSEILAALVRLVTTDPVPNRAAYVVAVGVLLELMATPQLEHFLQFSNVLLPWLVKLANRTSDEDMKARLVSTIVRFSSAILE